MRVEGPELRGLSQWVQLYTGAQINFGDLTPYLTYLVDIYLPFAYFDGKNYENLKNKLLQLSPVDLRRDNKKKKKKKCAENRVYLRRV